MPADVVNLRRARKKRDRAMAEKKAAENRLKFGRPLAERAQNAADAELAARRLEEHRRAPHPAESRNNKGEEPDE